MVLSPTCWDKCTARRYRIRSADRGMNGAVSSFRGGATAGDRYAGGRTLSTIPPMLFVHWCTPPSRVRRTTETFSRHLEYVVSLTDEGGELRQLTDGPARDRNVLYSPDDASGEMLMHLQKAIDYDVFARSLSIGAESTTVPCPPIGPPL